MASATTQTLVKKSYAGFPMVQLSAVWLRPSSEIEEVVPNDVLPYYPFEFKSNGITHRRLQLEVECEVSVDTTAACPEL